MFQRHSSCVLLLKTCLKGKVCNLGHLYDKSQIGTIKILTFIHSFIVAFLNYKICKVNIIFYSVEIKEGPKMNDNLFMPLS